MSLDLFPIHGFDKFPFEIAGWNIQGRSGIHIGTKNDYSRLLETESPRRFLVRQEKLDGPRDPEHDHGDAAKYG